MTRRTRPREGHDDDDDQPPPGYSRERHGVKFFCLSHAIREHPATRQKPSVVSSIVGKSRSCSSFYGCRSASSCIADEDSCRRLTICWMDGNFVLMDRNHTRHVTLSIRLNSPALYLYPRSNLRTGSKIRGTQRARRSGRSKPSLC
jgi:hypothetical protein